MTPWNRVSEQTRASILGVVFLVRQEQSMLQLVFLSRQQLGFLSRHKQSLLWLVLQSLLAAAAPVLNHCQCVANTKLALQVQRGPHSSQAPLHHDGDAVTQHVSLLHAVGCQHNGTVSAMPLYDFPSEPAHGRCKCNMRPSADHHAALVVVPHRLTLPLQDCNTVTKHTSLPLALCCQHNASVPRMSDFPHECTCSKWAFSNRMQLLQRSCYCNSWASLC